MKKLLPCTVAAILSLLLLSGCGKKAEAPSVQDNGDAETSETSNYDPARDPGRHIDEAYLVEQARKRDQLEKTIASFWKDKSGDPKVVRKMILNRKGELLSSKRNIRKSRLFTDAQKDSLVASLDEESMNLSRELVAFSE